MAYTPFTSKKIKCPVSIAIIIGSILASDSIDVKNETISGNIIVIIKNVDTGRSGDLIINLYTKKNWNKPEKVFRRQLVQIDSRSEYKVIFDSLPFPMVYAVQAVHDSDGNGMLTMKWLPPGPKEGAGVSNYIPTGIPKFQKAKFYYSGKTRSVRVVLTYPN